MPNTELPMDLESQVVLMKKYITFRQRKKMREFLGYAGYFRASRYGKFLLTQVNAFGSKADSKVFFELYDFDVQLRLLLLTQKGITKELQDLNADIIRTDIPTSATVTNVLVWNVEQSRTDDFTVAYEVDQQVKEGEQTQAVTENYTVTVHVDKDGAMVITQNPTLAPAVQKSKYEPTMSKTVCLLLYPTTMYFQNW